MTSSGFPPFAIEVGACGRAGPAPAAKPRYAICTLVTNTEQYAALLESFRAHGFDDGTAEFLYIDNTAGNQIDAYRGLSMMICQATADYCVLCHQDIMLIQDGVHELDRVIADLDLIDPAWAVAGNAGGTRRLSLALRISDPHGDNTHVGRLPARVDSLDENFILVRRDSNPTCSPELSGFHLYGADLCLRAQALGRTCYVVDFHVRHMSRGRTDEAFTACRGRIERHYTARGLIGLRRTTCTLLIFGLPNAWSSRFGGFLHRVAAWALGALERCGVVRA